MKHIFYVHSHITFLVAKQYIVERQLAAEDCLFLCLRGYMLPEQSEYRRLAYQYPSQVLDGENRLWCGIRLDKTIRMRRRFESFIENYCQKQPFLCYIPNTMASDMAGVLVSMSLCNGYYLIEEGNGSYTEKSALPVLYKGWQRLVYCLLLRPIFPRYYRLRSEAFFTDSPKFRGTVSVSEKCFPGIGGERIQVAMPFAQCQLERVPDVLVSVDNVLLRLYSLAEARAVHEHMRAAVDEKKKVAYKFHPIYYNDESLLESYRSMMKEVWGADVEELNRSVVLEEVLNTYHCDFYSDLSSIGVYSKPMGVRNYSYAKWLMHEFPNTAYEREFALAPEIVKTSYEYL